MKFFSISSFAIAFFMLFSGCSNMSADCQLALADLICDFAVDNVQVTQGEDFNLTSLVKNVPNTLEKCHDEINSTMQAAQSKLKMLIQKKNPSTLEYETVETQVVTVPPIGSKQQSNKQFGLKFNSNGEYKITTYADSEYNVEERAETNNESNLGMQAGKKMPLIITVVENPKFHRDFSKPIVEVVLKGEFMSYIQD